MSRLSNLRKGIATPHKIIEISGMDIAVTVISSSDIRECEEAVIEAKKKHGIEYCNENFTNHVFDINLVAKCMKDKDDLSIPLAESAKDVDDNLTIADINAITTAYSELMMNIGPRMEFISEEEYDSLKENLGQIPWKDLSTQQLLSLKNCQLILAL